MKHKPDKHTASVQKWIRRNPGANRRLLREFLHQNGAGEHGITHALHARECATLRQRIVATFKLK